MTQTQRPGTPDGKGRREKVPIITRIIFYGILFLIVFGTFAAFLAFRAV